MDYLEWNRKIAEFLFNKDKEGKRIFLYINRQEIEEIGEQNGTTFEDFVEKVKRGPDWVTPTLSFSQKAIKTYRGWRENKEVPYIEIDSEKFQFPPYIAYLVFCVIADEGEESLKGYWPKVEKLLGETKLGATRYQIKKLWHDLSTWTNHDMEERFGIFNVFTLGQLAHVGLPKGQMLFSASDLEHLPNIFYEAKINPEWISSSDLVNEIRKKGNNLRPQTRNLLKDCFEGSLSEELSEVIIEVLSEELSEWDGHPTEEVDSQQMASIILVANHEPMSKKLTVSLRCKSRLDIPREGMELTPRPRKGSGLHMKPLRGAYSKKLTTRADDLSPYLVKTLKAEGKQTYECLEHNCEFQWTYNPVKIFVEGNTVQVNDYLVESSTLPTSRIRVFHLLVHDEISEKLEECSEDFTEFSKVDIRLGLPEGWSFYKAKGVKSDKEISKISSNLRLQDFVRLKWEGGLKVGGSNTTFMDFARPSLHVPYEDENYEVFLSIDSDSTEDKETSRRDVVLIRNPQTGDFDLPEVVPTEKKMNVIVLTEGEEEPKHNITLRKNFTWPPLKPSLLKLNNKEEVIHDEEETHWISGARVSPALVNHNYSPTMLREALNLKKAIMLGSSPLEVVEWPKDLLDPEWIPVWALIPVGRNREYEVIFLGEETNQPSKLEDTELDKENKKITKKWKNSFLGRRRSFKFRDDNQKVEALWEAYKSAAENVK